MEIFILILIGIIFLIYSLKKNQIKGWVGEKKSSLNLAISLNSNVYHSFHNVILPSKNGTSQIDHIVISIYGVFIIETKNKDGWIFGSANQAKWTLSIYGNKYSFQNPLKQTFRQKKVLSEFLKIEPTKIFPIVNFVGNASFKTYLPANVINSGLGSYIKNFTTVLFSEEETNIIKSNLSNHIQTTTLTKSDHIESLKERISSNTVCPRCGGNLLRRSVKKGPNIGNTFLGCENFPRCKFTKN